MITAAQIEAELTADLTAYATGTDRSQQVETGASQLYDCVAATMFRLRGEPADPLMMWQAEVGSAIHARVAEARAKVRPGVIVEQRFVFKGVPATVDFIDPEHGLLIDFKTRDDAARIRSLTADDAAEHLPQLMLGAAGAREAGVNVTHVALAYLPRSGDLHVRVFGPYEYDEQAAIAGAEWSADVDTAAASDADPRDHRGKPAWWCWQWCEYATACRGEQLAGTDLADLAGPGEAYRAAQDRRDEAESQMRELRPYLLGARGVAGDVKITTSREGSKLVEEEDEQALRDLWQFVNADVPLPVRQVEKYTAPKLIVKWAKK